MAHAVLAIKAAGFSLPVQAQKAWGRPQPTPLPLVSVSCTLSRQLSDEQSREERLDLHLLVTLVVPRCTVMLNECLNEAFVCSADGPNLQLGPGPCALMLDDYRGARYQLASEDMRVAV